LIAVRKVREAAIAVPIEDGRLVRSEGAIRDRIPPEIGVIGEVIVGIPTTPISGAGVGTHQS
jgi:hypothetical protein